jgi:tripeptidyl-peptidase-1
MKSFYVFAALSLFSDVLTFAHPILQSYSLDQKRSAIPSGWSHIAKHNPSSTLSLRFGLSQPNINDIHEWLLDVSDPESPNYGNHWTPSQVADRFKPSRDTVRTVHNWLIKSGIDKDRIRVSHTRTWIELNATVEEAEHLLQTEYHVYEHHSGTKHVGKFLFARLYSIRFPSDLHPFTACESYYLPEHITPHIDLVTPTIDFTATIRKRRPSFDRRSSEASQPGSDFHPKMNRASLDVRKARNTDHCDKNITLSCLRSLYDFHYTPKSPSKNSIGIGLYCFGLFYSRCRSLIVDSRIHSAELYSVRH